MILYKQDNILLVADIQRIAMQHQRINEPDDNSHRRVGKYWRLSLNG